MPPENDLDEDQIGAQEGLVHHVYACGQMVDPAEVAVCHHLAAAIGSRRDDPGDSGDSGPKPAGDGRPVLLV